jgi:hypothetical protein
MATAPCPIESAQDDSRFVHLALDTHLTQTGLPAGLQFHDLTTSDQSAVLRLAQALKTASRA